MERIFSFCRSTQSVRASGFLMRIEALIHMADAALAITRSGRIIVFGSSSLLGSIPDADQRFELIRRSLDADFILDPFDDQIARVAQDALGADTEFARQFGYHADIVRPMACENFPPGWEQRLIPLDGCAGVFCLEPHDMAVATLFAGRPKDITLLAELIRAGLMNIEVLSKRLFETPMTEAWIVRTDLKLREAAEKGGKPLPR